MKNAYVLGCVLCSSLLAGQVSADPPDTFATAIGTDENGVEYYQVTSQYNGGTHVLRVLEPDNPAPGVPHSFLYVLPVQPELDNTFGDGLETIRGLDAQNTYNVTVIAPSFGSWPWYADHASDPNYRYESFMALELQPWVEARLTQRHRGRCTEQHWLLGFSKSGYGAISLLLKHPDLFTLGAFWDFPANMLDYRAFGAASNYGTQENFDVNYRLSATFLETYKDPFLDSNRIWINGFGVFQTSLTDFDALLTSAGIQHSTAVEIARTHSWTSGWVPDALEGLADLSSDLNRQCQRRWPSRNRARR